MTASLFQKGRWLLRHLLRYWPQRPAHPVSAQAREILLLFAGTYGDFVQVLPMTAMIAASWPKAVLRIYADKKLLNEFAFALPPRARRATWRDLLKACFQPADLLLVNAVGVYRVRYEIAALRLGKMAGGFRYVQESHRSGFGLTLPLIPEVDNFGELNQQLVMALVSHKIQTPSPTPLRLRFPVDKPLHFTAPVLFSVGSAGFRQATGFDGFLKLIQGVHESLGHTQVTFVAGPEDRELVSHLARLYPHRETWVLPIAALSERLLEWKGGVLGFDSFLAHFALYLGRRMLVLHQDKVPYGYDCGPFHKQLCLLGESGMSVQPVKDFLTEIGWGQNLPSLGGARQKLP